jgi:hypothetical protein
MASSGRRPTTKSVICWLLYGWTKVANILAAAVLVRTAPAPSQQYVPHVRCMRASQEEIIDVIGKYDSNMLPITPYLTLLHIQHNLLMKQLDQGFVIWECTM